VPRTTIRRSRASSGNAFRECGETVTRYSSPVAAVVGTVTAPAIMAGDSVTGISPVRMAQPMLEESISSPSGRFPIPFSLLRELPFLVLYLGIGFRSLTLAAYLSQAALGYRILADRLAKLALSWPRSRLVTSGEEA
jgi:hypothetical protein